MVSTQVIQKHRINVLGQCQLPRQETRPKTLSDSLIDLDNRFISQYRFVLKPKRTAGYPYPKEYSRLYKSDFIQLNKAPADIY